ncbi:glycosyl hydrolase 115 family protein [Filimonas effusa]|uniref:Glycosyhydrolase n=1 Tax=Filimonas effusa TaxID=2508721 RepID=A0A4Q1D3F8_9BACT|nr:glycosyl hydrolase 115 family protein [Filimonas effusa]RXK81942.1 glycosyhydrolase [Filimonas effusa]
MKKALFAFAIILNAVPVFCQQFVSQTKQQKAFSITASDLPAIYADPQDDWLCMKAATLLQHDIALVTGSKPTLLSQLPAAGQKTIIIGTIQGCAAIRKLIAQKQMNVGSIKGQWEAFQIQTIDTRSSAQSNTLVICGNDKRGAAYGVFELSAQLGVSPWYWWADVPARQQSAVYIKKGVYSYPSPSVKYRGIFINDEAPAFSGWTKEKFGGINHLVYEKVFELLLRLKANYLWPAMWGNAFNDDDTLNPILANKWGIVMGTSHHEPMLRAQTEWKRYGKGAWDYTKNESGLKTFWTNGIRNMGTHESIITVGMRGDGDEPMTDGTATALLERIVADQRQIIEKVTGKPASQTPQLWALYKEVQDYYDKGMRVPDDVTLLLCDDNWGNIRRLPNPADKPRKGGYGIYYHFDYVGGPRNYKWINTNNISRIWEQMHLAHAYGADKIWIVNVGDLKPMELPISFFLDYAYNTRKWNEDNITGFFTEWATQQFGADHAAAIATLLQKYSVYASRKKPELLNEKTYRIGANGEFDKIVEEWIQLRQQAEQVEKTIPSNMKDAYFQLVLHPIQAFENLHQLYYAVAQNRLLATQNNTSANQWADKALQYYIADSLLSIKYNKELANGKWNHMMDQTHIGYKYWQEPKQNRMPEVTYLNKPVAAGNSPLPDAGITTDKTATSLPAKDKLSLPASAYTKAIHTSGIRWKPIPDIGKNGSGMTSFPVTASVPLSKGSPCLEYEVHTTAGDSLRITAFFSPTLNFLHSPGGLRFAVSVDNGTPQVISLNQEENTHAWDLWVANNNIVKTSRQFFGLPGKHTIRYWMIDPGVILQKLEIDVNKPE